MKLFCKFIVLIISSLLIAGCSEQDEYDDKKQLLEVSIPSGEVIRQTTDNKTITELVKREKIEQWEEIKAIPPMSEALYIFTSYEAITDPLFLENDEEFDISMGKMTLYKNDKNYYIEYYIESAIDYMQIPTSAGEYLEEFASHKSKIEDKASLFTLWEENAHATDKEISGAKTMKDMKERIALWGEKLQALDVEEFTSQAIKTKKIDIIYFDSNTTYSITDSEEIAHFYNSLQEENWQETDKMPPLENEMFMITFSQPQKRTLNKKLIENSKVIICNISGEYWAIETIPSNELESNEMETFYKVPESSIQYLNELIQ